MNIIQIPRRFVRSDWGGTETVILESCKILLKEHHTEILCPIALSDKSEETVQGVKINRTPYFYPYFGLKDGAKLQLDKKGGNLFSFSLMRELKKRKNLDIIHLHTQKRLGGIGRHVAKQKKIPYVVSLHGGLFDVPSEEAATWTAPTEGAIEWGKLLGAWVGSRRVLDDAAAIICVGQKEQEKTREQFPQKKVVHLPNGVDTERFAVGDGAAFRKSHNIPQDAYVILLMGRIDPQKNQLFPIRMMPELLKVKPNAHLLLIGHVTNQPYYQRLLDNIGGNGVTDRVTLITGVDGQGEELVNAYHAADLFCLPSIHEPFGIVVLEAWAAGLPVIASRVGGIPSFVDDGSDGILFDTDDADSFLTAFSAIIGDSRSKLIAENGRQKANRQYSWQQITKRLVDIYEEAIRENPLR